MSAYIPNAGASICVTYTQENANSDQLITSFFPRCKQMSEVNLKFIFHRLQHKIHIKKFGQANGYENSISLGKMSNTTSTNFKVNVVLLIAMNVFSLCVGIFLNSIAIVTLLSSQLRGKLCYFMVLVLACFDLAVVVVFPPLLIMAAISNWMDFSWDVCSMETYYIEHLFSFSLTALFTLCLERYLALVYPFFHRRKVTKSKLTITLLILQVPFGIPYFSRLTTNSKSYIESCVLALVVSFFFAIIVLNYKIFRVVEELRKRAMIQLGNLNGSDEHNAQAKRVKVSSCLLALVCLLVSYFPATVLFLFEVAKPVKLDEETKRLKVLWVDTLFTINSTVNCFVFFYKNRTFRRHGTITMAKYFCPNSFFREQNC